MSKKWKYIIYIAQFAWCVWMVIMTMGTAAENSTWFNKLAFMFAVLLLAYWLWSIYRIDNSKPKQLDYILEQDSDGNWWVSLNEYQQAGPYPYRHEAFEWIIKQTQKEMQK